MTRPLGGSDLTQTMGDETNAARQALPTYSGIIWARRACHVGLGRTAEGGTWQRGSGGGRWRSGRKGQVVVSQMAVTHYLLACARVALQAGTRHTTRAGGAGLAISHWSR